MIAQSSALWWIGCVFTCNACLWLEKPIHATCSTRLEAHDYKYLQQTQPQRQLSSSVGDGRQAANLHLWERIADGRETNERMNERAKRQIGQLSIWFVVGRTTDGVVWSMSRSTRPKRSTLLLVDRRKALWKSTAGTKIYVVGDRWVGKC